MVVTAGCHVDTMLINVHEASNVSATRSWPPTEDGQLKVKVI